MPDPEDLSALWEEPAASARHRFTCGSYFGLLQHRLETHGLPSAEMCARWCTSCSQTRK